MRVCPICGKKYDDYPAISRIDNKTEICPDCGIRQALKIFSMTPEQIQKIIDVVKAKKNEN